MSNPNQNTKPNTTATAESALLSGDNTSAERFNQAADIYAKKAASLGRATSAADKALHETVKRGVELRANDSSIKRVDFMPEVIKLDKKGKPVLDKNGKPVVTQKQGRFGGKVGSTNQANRISKAVCNKTVQDAVIDATPNGTKTSAAIVDSVFTAKGWTSYVKLTKATAVKRDKYPLNKIGKKAKAEIEKMIAGKKPAGIEKSNSAGLDQYLHSIEAYRAK